MFGPAMGHIEPVDLDVTRDGDTAIIDVRGELDVDTSYRLFLAAADEAGAGARTLELDLRAVTFIDSTGLSMLIRCRDELARDLHTALVLRAPSKRVRDLLELTALTSHFTITPGPA